VLGTFAHATHFVMAFALGGLVVLGHALKTGRAWELLASGALLGLSILMEQNGVFFAALAAVQVAWVERHAPKRAARRVGLLAACAAVPLAATALWLYASGAWPRFWFWVVTYGSAYVSQVPLRQAPAYLAYTAKPILMAMPLLALMTAAGLAVAAAQSWRAKRPGFALVFAMVSAAAVCPGFWFRPHYYLLFVPAAAVLVAVAASALEGSLKSAMGATAGAVAVVALPALGAAQALHSNHVILFEASPDESSRLTYPQQPFPEAIQIAAYLKAHTRPEDRIAVLGSEPQIYFYAQRRGATGYLYTYPMMEPQPFAKRMQDEMRAEIEASMPAYLVFVSSTGSWLARDTSDTSIVDWGNRFAAQHYRPAGVIEIAADDGPALYYWDDALRTYRRQFKNRIVVYRRKA
jgi:hypothetical protein